MTPLMIAAQDGNIAEVERLLAAGADVNVNGIYGTALMMACRSGYIETVELLISSGSDVNMWRIQDGDFYCVVA